MPESGILEPNIGNNNDLLIGRNGVTEYIQKSLLNLGALLLVRKDNLTHQGDIAVKRDIPQQMVNAFNLVFYLYRPGKISSDTGQGERCATR